MQLHILTYSFIGRFSKLGLSKFQWIHGSSSSPLVLTNVCIFYSYVVYVYFLVDHINTQLVYSDEWS